MKKSKLAVLVLALAFALSLVFGVAACAPSDPDASSSTSASGSASVDASLSQGDKSESAADTSQSSELSSSSESSTASESSEEPEESTSSDSSEDSESSSSSQSSSTPSEPKTFADLIGVWSGADGATAVVSAVGAESGAELPVGSVIVGGEFVLLYEAADACYGYTEAGDELIVAYADGALTVGETAYTAQAPLNNAEISSFAGKWTLGTVKWYITDDGKVYYGASLNGATLEVVDKYAVLTYTAMGFNYRHVVEKSGDSLVGYYTASEKAPAEETFAKGDYYTLTVEGTLNQFVDAGSAPDQSKVTAPAAPAGQEFAGWVLDGTETPFVLTEAMTADASIVATFKEQPKQEEIITYYGNFARNPDPEATYPEIYTKVVVNFDTLDISFFITLQVGAETKEYVGKLSDEDVYGNPSGVDVEYYWYATPKEKDGRYSRDQIGVAVTADKQTLYLCSTSDDAPYEGATFTTSEPAPEKDQKTYTGEVKMTIMFTEYTFTAVTVDFDAMTVEFTVSSGSDTTTESSDLVVSDPSYIDDQYTNYYNFHYKTYDLGIAWNDDKTEVAICDNQDSIKGVMSAEGSEPTPPAETTGKTYNLSNDTSNNGFTKVVVDVENQQISIYYTKNGSEVSESMGWNDTAQLSNMTSRKPETAEYWFGVKIVGLDVSYNVAIYTNPEKIEFYAWSMMTLKTTFVPAVESGDVPEVQQLEGVVFTGEYAVKHSNNSNIYTFYAFGVDFANKKVDSVAYVNGAAVDFTVQDWGEVPTYVGNCPDAVDYWFVYKPENNAYLTFYIGINRAAGTLQIYDSMPNAVAGALFNLEKGEIPEESAGSATIYTGSITLIGMTGQTVELVWIKAETNGETAVITYKVAGSDTEETATVSDEYYSAEYGYYVKFGSGLAPKAYLKIEADKITFTDSNGEGNNLGTFAVGEGNQGETPASVITYVGEITYAADKGTLVITEIKIDFDTLSATYKATIDGEAVEGTYDLSSSSWAQTFCPSGYTTYRYLDIVKGETSITVGIAWNADKAEIAICSYDDEVIDTMAQAN